MDKKPENIGDLGEFFNIIGKAKKQKEDEFRSVVGDINLDGIFSNLKEENKKIKKKKKKEKKQIEELEKFLFEDVTKKEEPKKEEIPEDQEIPDENTKVGLTEKIEEVEEEIVAEVESEEVQENDHVDEAIKVLDKIVSNKEEISEETDYELIKKEIKELRTLIHRNVNGTSGGGEVRLEFLDDVDRDSAKVDGKLLKYQASTGKWVGGTGAGITSINEANDVNYVNAQNHDVLVWESENNYWANEPGVQRLVLDVRNNNVGYALTIGYPVYQTGYNSGQDRINIELAKADVSSTMPAKGLTYSTVENNTNGQIIVQGELEGIDTSSFDVADELYVAPGGGLTNTRPTDEDHLVQKIAVVLKKSVNGAVLVYGAGRTNDVPNKISIGGSITADSYYGDGVNLTGIVTSIVAGSNVTISGSTGRVTINASGGGGGGGTGGKFSDDQTNSGIHTTSSNVGLGTTNPRYQLEVGSVGAGGTQLWVNGDARITGILSVGTATITLDPTTIKVQIGTGITIDATTNTIEVAGSKIADTSGNSKFTGIVTAASFVKSGGTSSQFLKADGSVDTSTYSTTTAVGLATAGLASEDFVGLSTAGISTSGLASEDFVGLSTAGLASEAFVGLSTAGISTSGLASEAFVGLSTFTGDYNNLRNKPTIPTNNNELTNGAGYITGISGIDTTGTSFFNQLNVSGVSTFNGQIHLPDNTKIMLGADNDLQIVHIPNQNSIQGNRPLYLQSNSQIIIKDYGTSEVFAKFIKNGAVELYHDNSKKFETTGAGATVTGTLFSNQLNATGVVTATSIDSATLNSVANLNVASNALTIGTSADTVTIAGNLVVSGTETIIDVERLEVGDNNIGIASTNPKLNDAGLDGAGITIYGREGDKTLKWSNSNSRMEFNTALSASSFATSGAITAGSLSVSGSYGLSSKYTHQKITSSGSATETLNQSGRTATDIIIFVNGIAFLPTDDYTVSGTTLTFVEAPASSSVISVRYLPT